MARPRVWGGIHSAQEAWRPLSLQALQDARCNGQPQILVLGHLSLKLLVKRGAGQAGLQALTLQAR